MSRSDVDPSASLGGTIGARVAEHLRTAMMLTRLQMGPHQASIAQKILQDFTNHVSDEVRSVMSPLWQQIADSPDTSDWLRDLAHRLGNERGQAWAWIGGSATGAAMGSGLITLLTNELQPIIGTLIAENPHIPFSPDAAAAAVVRGLAGRERMARDAAQAGMDGERFSTLIQIQAAVMTANDVQTLYARGDIDRGAALRYLERAGYEGHHAGEILRLARQHISLPDAAAMANRSILTADQLADLAQLNGYDRSDGERFFQLTGEPLGIQDLFTALRRGIIDETRARRGWVQGPVRNEWFDTAVALQYAPMSTVDAADAVNQGHMTLAEGQRIAGWNGLMAEHFATLIENAGLPPGVELASEALNRGLITEDQFVTAFLESRLKNKYVPLYLALRYRVMPQETVRMLYRHGAFDYAEAVKRLGWAGFSPDDAGALLAAESADTSSAERDLTKAEILALFTDRAIDEATAREWLTGLGYPDDVVAWQIALAELRRSKRYSDAVIARARAGYVAGRLGQVDVANLLDSLQVPPDQREELLNLWNLERAALTKGLTVAQLQTALRRGLLGPDEVMAELIAQGYSERDAGVLVTLALPAS